MKHSLLCLNGNVYTIYHLTQTMVLMYLVHCMHIPSTVLQLMTGTCWQWETIWEGLPCWQENDFSRCVWPVWQGLCNGCPVECTGCMFVWWQHTFWRLRMFNCQVYAGEVWSHGEWAKHGPCNMHGEAHPLSNSWWKWSKLHWRQRCRRQQHMRGHSWMWWGSSRSD